MASITRRAPKFSPLTSTANRSAFDTSTLALSLALLRGSIICIGPPIDLSVSASSPDTYVVAPSSRRASRRRSLFRICGRRSSGGVEVRPFSRIALNTVLPAYPASRSLDPLRVWS